MPIENTEQNIFNKLTKKDFSFEPKDGNEDYPTIYQLNVFDNPINIAGLIFPADFDTNDLSFTVFEIDEKGKIFYCSSPVNTENESLDTTDEKEIKAKVHLGFPDKSQVVTLQNESIEFRFNKEVPKFSIVTMSDETLKQYRKKD